MIESVYIHIPFCRKICSYCDFCKMFYNEELVCDYLDALERESGSYNNELLKTIYIGGGTPSCLSISELKKLFSMTSKFKLDKKYEFTMEFNIEDIEEEKLILAKNNRVNRISIGIQTINEKFYSLINRFNDKEDIKKKINLCKKYFDNINIDLMYAFPGETIEDLKKDLDFFVSLNINHVSIYSLIIEENTKLYIDKIKPINQELESSMYYYIIKYLKDNGHNHYEISNFSKEGYESIHNLNYWNNGNYYGFGLGASGYISNIRYTNTRSIKKYISGDYILDKDVLDENKLMEEELICGLRKIEGVSKEIFKSKYKKDIYDIFDIEQLKDRGLIVDNGRNIYIPEDKLYVSNSILINFILE